MPDAGSRAESQPPPPLDDLMLAMDVVDTLRHQRALVEAELDEDARDARLVERIKEIYESQGIEVPDGVIREGVEGLKQDRFTYRPPERTLAVRLAGIYVTRSRWLPWLAGILVVALAGWGLLRWQGARRDAEARAAYAARVDALAADRRQVTGRLADVEARRAELAGRDLPAAGARLLETASERLDGARRRARDLEAGSLPTPAGYLDDPPAYDAALEERGRRLAALVGDLGHVEGQLEAVAAMLDLRTRLENLATRLTVPPEDPADAEEVARLRQDAEAAIARGDTGAARALLERLGTLLDVLAASYELRIVSEPGAPSGVRRAPPGGVAARNHYIVVDAIGADGNPVRVPVRNEEDQTIHRVSRFAVRVPQAVYEAVRRDKEDNGIVDDRLFGTKKRGAREPTYRFEVAGGMLTEW